MPDMDFLEVTASPQTPQASVHGRVLGVYPAYELGEAGHLR